MAKAKKQKVIWKPQPKQTEALVRREFEVLYGGARGGGKTDAGMAWLLYPVWDWIQAIRAKDFELRDRLKRYRALIIRKNADDLRDWIDRAHWMYTASFGESVTFSGKPVEITFGKDGPTFRTGHLKDENAYQKYQGHEYQRQLIEEVTQIPEERQWEDLISSCRSTIPEIEPQVFGTTNPDGPGFYWVKERWNIPDWPEGAVVTETPMRNRVFIPAKLDDNPALNEKDPSYGIRLENMKDESRRKAWRDGYWGEPIIEGVIFNEEIKKAREQGRITEVPWNPNHPVYTYWDIGRDATPILFTQLIGHAWHLIDFYEASGKGFDHYAEIIRSKPYWYGQHFGPHDLMKTDMANQTIYQIAANHGINFTIIPKAATADGIEAAKSKLARTKIDAEKCAPYLKRLSAFRREWDEEKQVFKDQYIHDWASHAGTATFYFGLAPDPANPMDLKDTEGIYNYQYT